MTQRVGLIQKSLMYAEMMSADRSDAIALDLALVLGVVFVASVIHPLAVAAAVAVLKI